MRGTTAKYVKEIYHTFWKGTSMTKFDVFIPGHDGNYQFFTCGKEKLEDLAEWAKIEGQFKKLT
jgi:hypothetical protein